MKNTKTFWTVDYTGIGYNGTYTAYFDNKAEAEKFAERDYADNIVRHTVSNTKTIAEYNEKVAMTRVEIN